jgi:hypothetical protein
MDFSTFQDIINKIDGVINSKVIVEKEDITEIHILANNLRSPKQIVRDVESSILASFDYRIDRRVVSVAQIETDDHDSVKRIRISGISMNSFENLAECCVKLTYDDQEYSFTQTGIRTMANKRKLVADCTVKVIEKILKQTSLFDVEDVIVNTNSNSNFVIVFVNMIVKSDEEIMIGSAIVRNDINEAIAKATLDAINRRIQQISI